MIEIKVPENAVAMEFEELYEDVYQSVEEFATSEMKYKLLLSVYPNVDGEDESIISLDIVKSPKFFPMRKRQELAESVGIPYKDLQYSDVLSYGLCASVVSDKGKNVEAMMEIAKKKAPAVIGMLGFFLDQNQNLAGNSGWDFINGKL